MKDARDAGKELLSLHFVDQIKKDAPYRSLHVMFGKEKNAWFAIYGLDCKGCNRFLPYGGLLIYLRYHTISMKRIPNYSTRAIPFLRLFYEKRSPTFDPRKSCCISLQLETQTCKVSAIFNKNIA